MFQVFYIFSQNIFLQLHTNTIFSNAVYRFFTHFAFLLHSHPEIRFSSPFMMHYYIEALFVNGMQSRALDCIKEFWGGILDAGFDCCPERFQFGNQRLSPYAHPAMNSACHAWSCTPSYWIRKFYR